MLDVLDAELAALTVPPGFRLDDEAFALDGEVVFNGPSVTSAGMAAYSRWTPAAGLEFAVCALEDHVPAEAVQEFAEALMWTAADVRSGRTAEASDDDCTDPRTTLRCRAAENRRAPHQASRRRPRAI